MAHHLGELGINFSESGSNASGSDIVSSLSSKFKEKGIDANDLAQMDKEKALQKFSELSPEGAGLLGADGSIDTESAMSLVSSKARNAGLGGLMDGAESFKKGDGSVDQAKVKEAAMGKLKGGFSQLGGLMKYGDSKVGYEAITNELLSDADLDGLGPSMLEPEIPSGQDDPWLALDAEADLLGTFVSYVRVIAH